jgi:hypothetical protein
MSLPSSARISSLAPPTSVAIGQRAQQQLELRLAGLHAPAAAVRVSEAHLVEPLRRQALAFACSSICAFVTYGGSVSGHSTLYGCQ